MSKHRTTVTVSIIVILIFGRPSLAQDVELEQPKQHGDTFPFACSPDDRFTGDRTAALDQGLHVSPSLHGYTRGAAERREETTRRRPDDDSHRVRLITDVFPLAIPESWQEGNQPGPPRLDPTASGKIPTRH
ncbi:MAG: hypothetical protein MK538_08190 [Planctomycetes bacterium]|nr:hypothetical protein [Planctomycetota bacterium]